MTKICSPSFLDLSGIGYLRHVDSAGMSVPYSGWRRTSVASRLKVPPLLLPKSLARLAK